MRPIADAEFFRLVAFVREQYGINLQKKRTLVESRLALMVEQTGFSGYAPFLRAAIDEPDGELCRKMINRLSTNYTFFFREMRAFEFLTRRVLPACTPDQTLDIWCAACASGEEAYALSMTLARFRTPDGARLPYRIRATDVNTDMLDVARRGVYPLTAYDRIPPEYRHFVRREREGIAVCDEIAAPITWARENLLACERASRADAVFCRNVMIYFTPADRARLLVPLHAALRPRGYLFLSVTESVDPGALFEKIEPAVYRKREAAV